MWSPASSPPDFATVAILDVALAATPAAARLVVMYLTGIYLPTVNWVAGGPVRTAIRTKYQLQGGVCSDCLLAWCCDPCTIVQQSKELRLRASAPATNLVMLHPGLVVQAHPVQPMNASSQPRTQDRDGHVVQHPFSANTSQVELG
eukprot:TRINITY_DN7841_c0_g1_i5.p1 TRINITY_DN7841_c0_g1~~TRINITY_DN7841_c0_g1_i5.p1  ORF type:complete len:146 (-),score=7.55 TRINITY_DN7841_c0_g1_i5:410-847(-)